MFMGYHTCFVQSRYDHNSYILPHQVLLTPSNEVCKPSHNRVCFLAPVTFTVPVSGETARPARQQQRSPASALVARRWLQSRLLHNSSNCSI